MSQFPQPTRPVHSSDLSPVQIPQASQNVNMDEFYPESSFPEEGFQFYFPHNLMPQPTAATEEEEKQAIDELIRVISEWYEKLPERIRSQINLDKFNVSSNNRTQQGFKVESTTIHDRNEQLEEFKHKLARFKIRSVDINTSRGVNGPGEEIRQKLDRFKIRTVQIGEVTQEEEVKR
ncbi:hypothetical protein QQP08_016874 [Theobroma cacao]|nr:hypothetical protein QQP08_016874 [Theobroma cacao]